ncbi:porin [soil metagenome]
MKPQARLLSQIALASFATTCAFTVCAQSSVTIYGVFDAGVEANDSGRGTTERVISGGAVGSRLGFRGAEDLGGGASALFRLEQGFAGDDGTLAQGGRAFGREATVGLGKRGLGIVTLGRTPTPVSTMQSYVDAFAWMGSGGFISLTRSGTVSRQVIPQVVNARVDNAIQYSAPVIANTETRLLFAPGEGQVDVGRNFGASARYTKAPFDLVAAFGRQDGAGRAGGRIVSFTVGGSYDFKPFKLYAGVTNEQNSCSTCVGSLARQTGVTGGNASEFRLFNIGMRYPVGAFTAIAQVVRVDDRSKYAVNPGDRDATWVAIGAEYALSKRTILYGALGSIDNQNGSQYALGSGGVQRPAGAVAAGDPRSTTATLGMRHSF